MEVLYGISSKKALNPRLDCSLHHCGCRYSNFIWVSQKLKLIYFEMPKAGCTSILKAFDISNVPPLYFAMAYLIHSQRYCSEQDNTNRALITMHNSYGPRMTLEEFRSACSLAASYLSDGRCWGDPIGKFEFVHFFGSPEQALNLFPDYRKFVILRDPIDRLSSAWNMFYNSEDWRLQARISQCENPAEEKKSLRYFTENMWACPNHHFNSIRNFVPPEIIAEGGVEVVLFENLNSYWEGLKKEYSLPALKNHNAAKNYMKADIEKSELLENERLLSYYSEDYRLMDLVR